MQSISSKNVYYQDSGYPIERNLIDLPLKKYKPVKKIGLIKVFNHLHYKLKGTNPLLNNLHWELYKKTDGIWHFFNGISFGKTPWVVTYETVLPRWFVDSKKLLRKGVRALAAKPCKKLIALSNCTKEFQIRYLKEHFPDHVNEISQKITVIHPAQQNLIDNYEEKGLPENKLVFTMVGADFFRKGGKEILLVFDELLKKDAPIELQIISSLNYGDYASKATKVDFTKAKLIIDKYPDHISHYKKLPNTEVLDKLKKSHVALLPTYGDTYGYFVLEAQACACPVITTNIRAMPEINNDKCGWMIDTPKDRWGNGVLDTEKDRTKFSDIIYNRLYKILEDTISNSSQIEQKGRISLKKIKEQNSPNEVARELEGIYDEALI